MANIDQQQAVREPRAAAFDVEQLREQFPILTRTMRGGQLVYLDNASTTQKPQQVIDAEAQFYGTQNANIHRGVYELSEGATAAYVAAHEAVARFLRAASAEEIIFTRNATEGLNLIAWAWAVTRVTSGDRILLTAMEHHSNIVPWQRLARARGATLGYVELTPEGLLDMDDLTRKIAQRPALLAVAHMSNVLGTVNPIAGIVSLAHDAGVPVVVDAAQSAARLPVDVRAWDVDFLVASAHKMYGPTGIGVVYGKREHLERMEPFLTGGDMVKIVTRTGATWNDLPWKFEAGTPNIAGGVAFGEAVRFLSELGMENVWKHEQALVHYALPKLAEVPGLKLLGPLLQEELGAGSWELGSDARAKIPPANSQLQAPRAGVLSFTLPGIHSHDLASFLDAKGIAIRGGHHCAQPLLATLGLQECARASVGITTTRAEIDTLVAALKNAVVKLGT